MDKLVINMVAELASLEDRAERDSKEQEILALISSHQTHPDAWIDKYDNTALHLAARNGFVSIVKALLDAGADIDRLGNGLSQYPVHMAAERGHLDVIKLLLENGADVNAKVKGERATPLFYAVKKGHEQCVAHLVRSGADVRVACGELGTDSLLHIAAASGRATTAGHLLDAGIDIDTSRMPLAQTPLMVAATRGQAGFVKWALENNADVNAVNEDGMSALHVSMSGGGDPDVAKVLLDHDADINAKCGVAGNTPLHLAVRMGLTECVDLLLTAGADANIKNNRGDTALHLSVESGGENTQAIIEKLLACGADINVGNNDGATPLHVAASRREQIVQFLLDKGADHTAKNNAGLPPISVGKWPEIIGLLLSHDPHQVIAPATQLNADLLRLACRLGTPPENLRANIDGHYSRRRPYFVPAGKRQEMLSVLIESGLDAAATDNHGNTLLHSVCKVGASIQDIALIMNSTGIGDIVNLKDEQGNTALHLYVRSLNTPAVTGLKMLLDAGADVNIMDGEGNTPLALLRAHLGYREQNADAEDLLLNAGAVVGREHERPANVGYRADMMG